MEKRKKLIMIISISVAGLVTIVLILGIVLYLLLVPIRGKAGYISDDVNRMSEVIHSESNNNFSTTRLDTFIVILDKEKQNEPTVSVTMMIDLAYPKDNDKLGEELENRKAQINEVIQTVVAKQKQKDIIAMPKREHELKEELIENVNRSLTEGEIVDIYILSFSYDVYD